jgi:hypothetical protein
MSIKHTRLPQAGPYLTLRELQKIAYTRSWRVPFEVTGAKRPDFEILADLALSSFQIKTP